MQKVQGKGCFGLQDWRNLITFETRNEITKNISWKIANMTVFDCDFLHDDIEMVAQATIVATIVDGDEGKRLICYRHGETDFDDELRKKSGIEEAGLLIYGRL